MLILKVGCRHFWLARGIRRLSLMIFDAARCWSSGAAWFTFLFLDWQALSLLISFHTLINIRVRVLNLLFKALLEKAHSIGLLRLRILLSISSNWCSAAILASRDVSCWSCFSRLTLRASSVRSRLLLHYLWGQSLIIILMLLLLIEFKFFKHFVFTALLRHTKNSKHILRIYF